MTTFAVTGASGPFGRAAVEALLQRGVAPSDVVALARTPARAPAERGVAVREADYNRPETLGPALAGVTRLLLVSGNEVGRRVTQHTAVVEAARAAGVERIAYTSIVRADTTGLPLAVEHAATEEVLRSSGVPSVLLRNSWYVENYTSQVRQYVARGEIVGSAGSARVAAAPRAELAAAAVSALVAESADPVYELGGTPFTFDELAAAVSEVTGTHVVYRDVSLEEFRAGLLAAGLDEGTAGFLTTLEEGTARGDLDVDSGDLERLLGRPSTPLREALRSAL